MEKVRGPIPDEERMDAVHVYGDRDGNKQRRHTSFSPWPAEVAEACVSPLRVPFCVSAHVEAIHSFSLEMGPR
jgi:hypothetical protein